VTAEPIPVRVLRHRCPFCGRTASRPGRAREHIARCWHNPAARGCKTCRHFDGPVPEWGDTCAVGVDLAGRRACPGCGGFGWCDISAGAQVPCNSEVTAAHIGNGAEIKPGPIIGCHDWEPDNRCWHGNDCDGSGPDCEPNNPTTARLAAETEVS